MRLLCLLVVLILQCFYAVGFELSKPKVVFDDTSQGIFTLIFIEGGLPKSIERVLKRNLDIDLVFEVKFVRKDFRILNIQTVITNIITRYKVSYDIVSGRYTISNPFIFKSYANLDELVDMFFPLLVRIDLNSLKDNPDFSQVYDDTEFFISLRAKIIYLNLKPPLNIITSIVGLGNYETPVANSETFKIR
ncbi:MAG: DUF4390 domain-containing protein [Brevinematales bacterium]|nr:DUF4390 domain-containing protein [Brevinematales bacterium]